MKNFKKIIKITLAASITAAFLYWIIPFIVPTKAVYIAETYYLEIENPYDELSMNFDPEIVREYINENKFVRINGSQYKYLSNESISLYFAPAEEPFNSMQVILCLYQYDHSVLSDGSKTYNLDDDDIEFFKELFKVEDIED